MFVVFEPIGREGVRRRAPMALVLAAALLFCHGVFGASHALAHEDAAVPVADGGRHAPDHAPAGHAREGPVLPAGHPADRAADGGKPSNLPGHTGHPVDTAAYFAVLLALAGVALLASHFAAGRTMLPARARPTGIPVGAPVSWPLAQGPSPPLLQVFRL